MAVGVGRDDAGANGRGRRPYHPRITHQPRDWASELRRLHGRGHARARRPVRRALTRFVVLAVVAAGIIVVIIVVVA